MNEANEAGAPAPPTRDFLPCGRFPPNQRARAGRDSNGTRRSGLPATACNGLEHSDSAPGRTAPWESNCAPPAAALEASAAEQRADGWNTHCQAARLQRELPPSRWSRCRVGADPSSRWRVWEASRAESTTAKTSGRPREEPRTRASSSADNTVREELGPERWRPETVKSPARPGVASEWFSWMRTPRGPRRRELFPALFIPAGRLFFQMVDAGRSVRSGLRRPRERRSGAPRTL